MTKRSQRLTAALLSALAAIFAASAVYAEHLIAVVATKGSPHQPAGDEVLVGAAAAVSRINAAGGLLGEPARIVGWSEDCTRERAQLIAEEILAQKPRLVVGHLCAVAAMAAAPIYARAGILFIAPGVRTAKLSAMKDAGGLTFRLAGRDDRFPAEAAALVAARYGDAGVAIVADRTKQARGLAAGVAAELARRQIGIRLDERIESGEKRYAATSRRIADSGAAVVIMPAQPTELGIIAGELADLGRPLPFLGSEILAVPGTQKLPRPVLDRLVLMLPWTGLEASEPIAGESDAERSARAVRVRAEAAVEVWAEAAKRAGSADPLLVAVALRGDPLTTVAGPLRFEENGDAAIASYVASRWNGSRWVPLAP